MPWPTKDLGRLADGLSLIAKEVVKRSHYQNQNGDLQSLINLSLKKAILSVTDFSGLTSGRVREFATPPPHHHHHHHPSPNRNYSQETSVVYFRVEEKDPQTLLHPDQAAHHLSAPGSEEVPLVAAGKIQGDSPVGSTNEGNGTNQVLPPQIGCDSYTSTKDGLLGSEDNVAVSKDGAKETAALITTPTRQRRPRERRVPSTPFSRALG